MSLVPWKTIGAIPFSGNRMGDDLSSFQREMNNLMANFFTRNEFNVPTAWDMSFFPTVDVTENNEKYLLDADMPGFEEDEVEIEFKDNVLTISGEKKSKFETSDFGNMYAERLYGAFRRDIPFFEDVNEDQINAELKGGVLHIELRKKENSQPERRKIAIKS